MFFRHISLMLMMAYITACIAVHLPDIWRPTNVGINKAVIRSQDESIDLLDQHFSEQTINKRSVIQDEERESDLDSEHTTKVQPELYSKDQHFYEQAVDNPGKRSISEHEGSESKMDSIHTTIYPQKNLCEDDSYEPDIATCSNSSVTSMAWAYTCKSRCNDPKMKAGAFTGPYCSCHPLCLISHDCCQDFQQFCPEHYELGERKSEAFVSLPNSLAHVECMNPYGTSTDYTFWMVDHCPEDNVNENIRMKCELGVTDFIQILPVVSEATDVIYKNFFCAKCNNVIDVVPWGLNVTCDEVWEDSIDSPQRLLDLVDRGDCYLDYHPPVQHICVSAYLSQPDCATNCLPKYTDMCKYGFQMPVSSRVIDASFKNIYCFFICAEHLGLQMDTSCTFNAWDSVSPIYPGELAKFSFGILVDYNPSAGNNVGFVFKDNTKTFGCDMGNSKNSDCVSYCADGFQYTNRECILKYHSFDMIVMGKWSTPDPYVLRVTEQWRWLKKTLTELFLEILESSIIVSIGLEQDYDKYVYFYISSKYKLTVDNVLPLEEIHTTLFDRIVSETVSVYPRRTDQELNLFEACLDLFGRESCWNHGRITKSRYIMSINNRESLANESNEANQSAIDSSFPPKTELTKDCPRKMIDTNSFEVLTNGSVLLLDSRSVLLEDEFILVGNMVYVCVNESEEYRDWSMVWKFDETMGLLTILCTVLSLVCMFIRLILQPFVPLFQNFPGKLQFLFILSLFLASLFFLIGPNCIHIKELCITFGVIIHWSYLAVFTWTVIIARDMFYIFSPSSFTKSADRNISVLKLYTLLAWGIPAVIVAIAIGLDYSDIDPTFRPMYGRGICWITQRYALLIFFTCPIAVSILVNIGFFIPTAISLWKSMNTRVQSSNKTSEYPFGIYVKLFCLMGFTWIFAFIAPYNTALWYIFIVLNASQGVYIFLAFVLRKQVWDSLFPLKDSNKSKGKTDSTYLSSASQQNRLISQQDKVPAQSPRAKKDTHNRSFGVNQDKSNIDSVELEMLSGES